MRQQPGQKWMSFVAEQYYTTNPPAFLWHCKMQPFPLIWISAADQFSEGHGNMRIKLLSIIPMGNARGSKMDQGELIWFPTAWLSDTIEWQAIDANSVKATMREQNVTAPVVLHMNEQGHLTHVTADRYMGEHGQLTPWSVQCNDYQEVEGMHIPTSIEVTWHLASGDFTWFRCKLTEIEYNQSGKVTRWYKTCSLIEVKFCTCLAMDARRPCWPLGGVSRFSRNSSARSSKGPARPPSGVPPFFPYSASGGKEEKNLNSHDYDLMTRLILLRTSPTTASRSPFTTPR
jgi:hypothetical protein